MQETTSLILDALKGEGGQGQRNKPEDAPLVTRLLRATMLRNKRRQTLQASWSRTRASSSLFILLAFSCII